MDNQEDSDCTYFLRSKRRRTDHGEEATALFSTENPLRRKCPIMLLPLEVLQSILKYIPHQELNEQVRKVNHKFKMAAEDLLNKSFKSLEKRLGTFARTVLRELEMTEDDMEVKCLSRLLNMVDMVYFQQTVIMATIWRYVYNEYYRTTRSCMYGGLILDLYEKLLHKCHFRPYEIYGPAVVKDYVNLALSNDLNIRGGLMFKAVPNVVKRIIYLSKHFCIHFDRFNEENVKSPLSQSGCKIIDLLDSASCASKSVIFERTINNTFSAKYGYYFQNAWFITFPIPVEEEVTLSNKQKLMHMRIRRIALAHSDTFMKKHHYQREVLFRGNQDLLPPSAYVYAGYGDVHDTFYYYGVMNDAAYLEKFNQEAEEEDEDVEDEIEFELLPNIFQQNERDEFLLVPHLGLDIDIRIDCPLAYAPYKYIRENEHKIINRSDFTDGAFNMTMEFSFPGAYYTRLPAICYYDKRIIITGTH